MDKIKEYKYIILIILLILGFAFYWFELRPTQIRKECFESTRGNPLLEYEGKEELQKSYYLDCLMGKGLKN